MISSLIRDNRMRLQRLEDVAVCHHLRLVLRETTVLEVLQVHVNSAARSRDVKPLRV